MFIFNLTWFVSYEAQLVNRDIPSGLLIVPHNSQTLIYDRPRGLFIVPHNSQTLINDRPCGLFIAPHNSQTLINDRPCGLFIVPHTSQTLLIKKRENKVQNLSKGNKLTCTLRERKRVNSTLLFLLIKTKPHAVVGKQ